MKPHRYPNASCAGLTRASLVFEGLLRRKMDCRDKPGNDSLRSGYDRVATTMASPSGLSSTLRPQARASKPV
jgi:hypothetical protein